MSFTLACCLFLTASPFRLPADESFKSSIPSPGRGGVRSYKPHHVRSFHVLPGSRGRIHADFSSESPHVPGTRSLLHVRHGTPISILQGPVRDFLGYLSEQRIMHCSVVTFPSAGAHPHDHVLSVRISMYNVFELQVTLSHPGGLISTSYMVGFN